MKKKHAFLKWAGGKYQLLNKIKQYLPTGECLVEPFVGAGSVFLNTNYSHYILADINHDLINLYKIVKQHVDTYVSEVRKLFTPKNNDSKIYYHLRNEFNQSDDKFYRALLFLYLNRYGYNGLCRYNLNGEFNVPFGSYRKPYFPQEELYYFAEKSQNACFFCEPYTDSMARASENSVIYCDPPYVSPSTISSLTTMYHSNRFSIQQQKNLAKIAENLATKFVPVLISNHDTKLTRELYQIAKLYNITARRNISSNGSKRKRVKELLALYKL